jgi:hypothetical protein
MAPPRAEKEELKITGLELEMLLHACSYLAPRDLGRLACATRCFGGRSEWASSSSADGSPPPVAVHSLVEEASRRWVLEHPLDRDAAPRWAGGRSCWLRHMHAIRTPLEFSRKGGGVRLSAPGCPCRLRCQCPASLTSSQHRCEATKYGGYGYLTAASEAVMRRGRHCAEFTLGMNATAHHSFGVIHPQWDVEDGLEGGKDAHEVDGHCFFHTDGTLRPGGKQWEGMQRLKRGDRIALLLDFDAGTMTVYKNDERLGVMATGLSGEYCWAVAMVNAGDSARIVHASVPELEPEAALEPEPEPLLELQPQCSVGLRGNATEEKSALLLLSAHATADSPVVTPVTTPV